MATVQQGSDHEIELRNARVDHYRQLVRPIALHYARRSPEPLDDLIQVGLMGLLRAAELFNPTSATPFGAFARPHIRGAILHYLRDRLQPIRLPRRLQEQLDRRRHCLAQAQAAGEHCPGEDRLRRAMGLTHQQWTQLERARQLTRMLPLEPELLVASAPATEPADQEAGAAGRALQALRGLDPDLAAVVQRVVLKGWSYRRTAQQLAISPMTVQRRLHKGLALLRQRLDLNLRVTPHPVPSGAPAW